MNNQNYWNKVTKNTTVEWLCSHKLLSKRASNILIRGAIYRCGKFDYHPIKTIKELLEIDECELKLYRNMGTKTLEEIEKFKEKFLEKSNVQKMLNPNEPITEKGQADWLDGYKVGFSDGVIAMQVQLKDKLHEIENELLEVNYGIQKID